MSQELLQLLDKYHCKQVTREDVESGTRRGGANPEMEGNIERRRSSNSGNRSLLPITCYASKVQKENCGAGMASKKAMTHTPEVIPRGMLSEIQGFKKERRPQKIQQPYYQQQQPPYIHPTNEGASLQKQSQRPPTGNLLLFVVVVIVCSQRDALLECEGVDDVLLLCNQASRKTRLDMWTIIDQARALAQRLSGCW
eukprot:TRINITY_DN77844_c0_g1_i1.p1 TRINITY_DN77844_c0_g1~~TRINITY_DN77844_c0_g1_i1.p1  ORF type:complete len:211 (-),score=5.07 TRINITY_DN77844_c0_g1_i1:94-684(-)